MRRENVLLFSLFRTAAAADDVALLQPLLYEGLTLLFVEEQWLTTTLAQSGIELLSDHVNVFVYDGSLTLRATRTLRL